MRWWGTHGSSSADYLNEELFKYNHTATDLTKQERRRKVEDTDLIYKKKLSGKNSAEMKALSLDTVIIPNTFFLREYCFTSHEIEANGKPTRIPIIY